MRQILILSLAPAIGVGLVRFSYALVLPDMRESLDWSYATAGFMNTINSVGYFAGAVGAALAARHFGLFRTVLIGTIMCVVSIALCAASGNFFSFSLGRILGGVGAAIAFVCGASLASTIAQAHPSRSGLLMGFYNSGPGTGLVLAGATAPFVLQALGPGSWWIVWGMFAVMSAAMTLLLLLAPRNVNATPAAVIKTHVPIKPMGFFLASYFMFGAGYIAYMTFMFAYVRDAGGSAALQSMFWCLIGLGAWVSPWLWRSLMARGQSGFPMAVLLATLLAATLFARYGQSQVWLAVSAFLFGSASIGVGTSILTFARMNYPPAAWPRAISLLTIVFSIGQTLGPGITGLITDALGSLNYALLVSAVTLAIGIVFALLQKPIAPSAAAPEK